MRLFWAASLLWLGVGLALTAWLGPAEAALAIGPGTAAPNIPHSPARRFAQADDQAQSPATGAAPPPPAPIVVKVGLRIHQITSIDQKSENFGIVADLVLGYRDPALAFDAAECACTIKFLHAAEVVALAQARGTTWPEIYYYNKQGRIFYDTQIAEIKPDGQVRYFERLSATFQAPDFDFRRCTIDRYVLWWYPIGYALGVGAVAIFFFA